MMNKVPITVFMALFIFSPMVSFGQTGDTQKEIQQPVEEAIDARQATQQHQEAWRQEKESLTARFEQLQAEQSRLTAQQEQLTAEKNATQKRLAAKEKQLADIEQISTQIQPFLEELVTALQTQIEEDLPFLTEEREKRLEKLKTLMADPEVDAAERYRKVMEALLVEAEYGFTIETYQQTISVEERPLLADIFRLGRLALFYQSLDGKKAGVYNVAEDKWEPLAASYNRSIHTAMEIAAKRQPVELLALPVGRLVIQ